MTLLHYIFDLTSFYRLGKKYKNSFVPFLVQIKTFKSPFEINWPLDDFWLYHRTWIFYPAKCFASECTTNSTALPSFFSVFPITHSRNVHGCIKFFNNPTEIICTTYYYCTARVMRFIVFSARSSIIIFCFIIHAWEKLLRTEVRDDFSFHGTKYF